MRKLKQIIAIFLLLLLGFLNASAIDKQKRFSITVQDSLHTYQAEILAERLSSSIAHKDLFYFWYKNNLLYKTKGGFDGRVLDGSYGVYNLNTKNFEIKGHFSKGLKHGIWIEWYGNGNIKERSIWEKGKKDGYQEVYNEEGRLTKKVKYKNNDMIIPYEVFDSNGTIEKRYIINGKEEVYMDKIKSGILGKAKKIIRSKFKKR